MPKSALRLLDGQGHFTHSLLRRNVAVLPNHSNDPLLSRSEGAAFPCDSEGRTSLGVTLPILIDEHLLPVREGAVAFFLRGSEGLASLAVTLPNGIDARLLRIREGAVAFFLRESEGLASLAIMLLVPFLPSIQLLGLLLGDFLASGRLSKKLGDLLG